MINDFSILSIFNKNNWFFYDAASYWIFLDENDQPYIVSEELKKKMFKNIKQESRYKSLEELIIISRTY